MLWKSFLLLGKALDSNWSILIWQPVDLIKRLIVSLSLKNSAIYDKLSLAGTSHQEALCHAALDEIDPNIRFCGYRLRLAKDGVVNVEELVKMSDANKGSGSDVLMREIEVKRTLHGITAYNMVFNGQLTKIHHIFICGN